MSRTLLSPRKLALVAVLVASASASADVSQGVISQFKGQLVVTKDDLPEPAKSDKETVAKIKAAQLHELVGTGDEVAHWHFHYTAFLSKTGSSALRLEFVTDDARHQLSADKRLEGVDPKSYVLSGDIAIDEDEGLAKGHTYSIEVVAGTNTVVAKSTVTFK